MANAPGRLAGWAALDKLRGVATFLQNENGQDPVNRLNLNGIPD